MFSDILREFEGKTLTLPALPSSFIVLREENEDVRLQSAHLQAEIQQPFSATSVQEAYLASITTAVEGEDVKPVYDLTLRYQHTVSHRYQPGDTIAILPHNTESDVRLILDRLHEPANANIVYRVAIDPNTTKKAAKLPLFVPPLVSLQRLFTECLDLRAVPKKAFLRALAPYTITDDDRRILEIFCSKEGTAAYECNVLKQGMGLIDLLASVPSCRPTAALLIEHLPRLMPRPYSIANVFRDDRVPESSLRILFSHNSSTPGITTEYLRQLETGATVYFYFRRSDKFYLNQEDMKRNIIMIATGTGISPYLAFLESRADALARGDTVGQAELIVGFRYRERSYLCKEEIAEHLSTGVLDVCHEAFSRDENTTHKYVQSQIRANRSKIIANLRNPHGLFYVCGDSKILLPQITSTVVDLLAEEPEAEEKEDIKAFVDRLKVEGKYREDVWL